MAIILSILGILVSVFCIFFGSWMIHEHRENVRDIQGNLAPVVTKSKYQEWLIKIVKGA